MRPLPIPSSARLARCLGAPVKPWVAAVLLALSAGMSPVWAAESATSALEIERQFRNGETRPALQRLDEALAQRPGDATLRFLKAVLLTETGRSAEALPLLERMTEEFPELPEPYNNLAVLQAGNGQLDRARGLLETALRLDPGYRTAHENLGDVFVRLAQRAYEAATGTRSEPALQTKLRLVRELAAVR